MCLRRGFFYFRLCYILVLFLIDTVDWRGGRRLLRDEACRTIHRRSASDEEDWRAPRGKRPTAAEINNIF